MSEHDQPTITPSEPEPQSFEDFWGAFAPIIRANEVVRAAYDERYAIPPSATPLTWRTPGAIQSYASIPNGVLLTCEHAYVELRWINAQTLRVRLQTDSADFAEPFSYAVVPTKPDPVPCRIYEDEDFRLLYLATDTMTILIPKPRFGITIENAQGKTVYQEMASAAWSSTKSVALALRLAPDEACYGTGQRTFDLNLRGQKLQLWNLDAGSYYRGLEPINYCVPFYLGVHDHGVYGVLWDNSHRGILDLGASDPDQVRFEAEKGDLCYYIFMGKDTNSILSAYTALTGRMPLPPLWSLGYHQSRYSYETQEEVLSVARELRQRQIPCDAIHLDIHYMEGYRIFTWDKTRFPDLKGMISQLHTMGMRVVTIIDPGVKVDETYSAYTSGRDADVFCKYPDGAIAEGVVWPGLCAFPDFTADKTRQWWSNQYQSLLETGVDGIWNDMNEPVYFSLDHAPYPQDYVRHDKEGLGADHVEAHNVYGMLMGRATLQALETYRQGKRQFNIIRAGYAGSQRYASSWTGDIRSRWDNLRLSVSMMLNLALSGQSFTGPDVGGFAEDTTPEMLVRWTQACALMPFFRNHSAIDTVRQEPYAFGEPYETMCREAIELRYRLLPYLYTVFAQCHFDGYPILRPLFTAEPLNPHLRGIDDCYLLGDELLIAPILNSHTLRRTVYLPVGDWYDFHTHKRYTGGHLINVEAPLERLPLFVRSGVVLPMVPTIQHTGDVPSESLTLRVYVDSGKSLLYEDEGEGLGYQAGNYRWTRFVCEETATSLHIQRHTEGAYQPPYRQFRLEVIGATKRLQSVSVDGVKLNDWRIENGILHATVGEFSSILLEA